MVQTLREMIFENDSVMGTITEIQKMKPLRNKTSYKFVNTDEPSQIY